MGPDDFPCLEPDRPPPRPRFRCRLSLSIVILVLSPTAGVMVAVALIAWFMMYATASDAVEAVGQQGQEIFVEAMRESILAYTGTVQRYHAINRARWLNTSCNGMQPRPNVSAWDAYDDVRLTLWSQVYNVPSGACAVGVAFPYGSLLGYQRTESDFKWSIIDDTTGFWVRKISSNTWKEGWANGSDTLLLPGGVPLNMSKRVWFMDAVRIGKQAWSAIYRTIRGEYVLPAVLPVYHVDGRLKLVAEAEVSIQQLDSFFTALKLTPHTFAFVTELDGSLVASSPEGLSTALPALPTESGALKVRVAAQSAGDGRIAEAATWLVQHFGSFYAVPVNDSDFVVSLEGQSHYLFTGHVQDRYGLHWVIVIGLPRSDVLHNLDAATVGAILSISATLLMSMACLGAVAGAVRQHLRRCARRIALMGTMDLERAKQLEGALILEEVQLVLLSLRDTICNLQQFRAFLPPTVLDKVRQAEPGRGEVEGGPAGPPPPRWRSHESRASITEPPGPPPHDTGGALPDDVLPATPVLRDGAVASSSGPYSRSLVHAALERRMGRVAVTLVALQLPGLHGTHPATWTPVDFMLWYEACLSTALAIVQTCHGDFYRLSGDQLLFSWGAVRQVATRCGNACQAALHLSQQLQMLDAQAAHGVQYAPRLSVVAGSVLCGVMGTTTARDLYLIGPLVRQAARLAALNREYGTHVLADSEVAKQCEPAFKLQVCGLVFGDEGEVQPVYEVLGQNPDPEEWMYRPPAADSRSEFSLALDALGRGAVEEAHRRLEAWVARTPGDRHARRLLGRIAAHGTDRAGLEGLVD